MFKLLKVMILLIWITVIFAFSLQVGSDSSNTSGSLLDLILNIFIDVDTLKENNIEIYENCGYVIRKIAHMAEFTVLSLLLFINFKNIKYSFVVGLLIAMIDEIIQLFVPGRSGNVTDVFIDSVGVCIGLLIVLIYLRIKEKKYDN